VIVTLSSLLIFLLVGLIAGLLAALIVKIPRPRIVAALLLGCIGSLLGNFLAGLVGIGAYGILGQILIATAGAVLLVWLLKFVR
jgi:uncharacterized membrane protein YeaQ/YmgE (transglycosylase-associated protein family)